MGWKPTEIGDLSGRSAIVTGANSEIGFVEAKTLAEHGAHVILAVRNVEAGRTAAARIEGSTVVQHLDLASLDSVRQFADGVQDPVDLLIWPPPRRRSRPRPPWRTARATCSPTVSASSPCPRPDLG